MMWNKIKGLNIFKNALLLFILFTALAAFAHSSWVLSTMFGGVEPAYDSWLFSEHFKWAVSGWLIAFSLDFGMMAISHDIQEGHGNGWKWVAFFILSFFTYILQLSFMAIHKPPMELGKGVDPSIGHLAQLVLDYGLYIFPAMLPSSTAIYTLAYRNAPVKTVNIPEPKPNDNALVPVKPELIPANETAAPQGYYMKCEYCDWAETFDTPHQAKVNKTKHMKTMHGDV